MKLSKRGKRRVLIVCSVVVALIAAVAALVLTRGAAQDDRIAEARAEGLAAYAEGDYETALSKLSVWLSSNRKDIEALVAFADTRSKVPVANNRHVLEAIGLYHAILELDRDHVEAMSGLLLLYERAGRRVEMRELADRILVLQPDNLEALRLRGLSAYLESNYEVAMQDAARLIELEPANVEWRALYLQILRSQNRPLAELLNVCEQWDEQYEGDGRYRLMMAQLHAAAGQLEAAVEVAREAALRGADDGSVLNQMVNMLDAMQLRGEADELIQRTQEAFAAESWPYTAEVRRHWQGNRLDDGLEVIEQVLASQGEIDQDLQQWQALLLLMLNRADEAQEVVQALREQMDQYDGEDRDIRRAWLLAIDAKLNAESAPWNETRNAYQVAVSLAPREAVLHFFLGEAYMEIGEYDLAARSLQRAQQSDPHWLGAHVAYAESLRRAGQVERALEVAERLVMRVHSPGITAYLLLARTWLDAGRANDELGLTDRATGNVVTLVDLLQRLDEMNPGNATIRPLLARAAAHYGNRAAALAVLEEALLDEQATPEMLVALASISHRHRLGLEDRLLDHARNLHGMTIRIAETAAYIEHHEGRSTEGLAMLREALEQIEGEDAAAQQVLAGYLAAIEHPSAFEALRQLLQDDPTTAGFVLGHDWTWEDQELTRLAIDQLATSFGEDSPRVAVAKAHYVLRHEADDAAALADAEVTLGEVLHRVPDSLAALNLMAHIALQGERPNIDRAIRHLEDAVRVYPHHADLYIRLVSLLQRRGDFITADQYLARLRTLGADDPNVRKAELELWQTQGNFERVIERLGETIDATSSESERLMYAANLHRAGRQDEAGEILKQLLQEEHSPLAVLIAAQFYADMGRLDEAVALVQQSAVVEDDVARTVMLGRLYQHAGRAVDAKAQFEQALKLDPRNVEALSQLLAVLLSLGDNQAVYDLARTGLELDPENESIRSSLAMAAMQLGSQEQQAAMDLMNQLQAEDTAMSQTLQVFSRISKPDGLSVTRQDLQDLRNLTLDFPHYMPAWRLAVIGHAEAGEMNAAIRLAREAAARLPHLPDGAQLASQLLVQAQRLDEALSMAQTWRQRSLQRVIEPDTFIAAVLLDLKRHGEAASQLQPHADRIVMERDAHPQRLSLWLQAALATGQLDDAKRRFGPIFDESGTWQNAWLTTAKMLDNQDIAREAIEFAAAHAADDQSAPWLLTLASSWSHFGHAFNVEEAFSTADELARQAEDEPDFHSASLIIRAQNAQWSGDLEGAIGYYREALSMEPENAVVLNNLASLLHRSNTHCEEAETLAAKAVKLAPDIPEIHNTYALTKLCLQDAVTAAELARTALKARPESTDFLVTLGLALAAQELWPEAQATLSQIERLLDADIEPVVLDRVDRLRDLISQATALGQASDAVSATALE